MLVIYKLNSNVIVLVLNILKFSHLCISYAHYIDFFDSYELILLLRNIYIVHITYNP